jgi:hypothetical protein
MTDVTDMIKGHIKYSKTIENYNKKDPLRFVYIESNNDALASDHVAGQIVSLDTNNSRRTRIESRDPKNKGRVGVWTHPSTKKVYNDLLVYIMAEGRLRIADKLISANPETRIEELLQQMRSFRREEMPENENPAFQDQLKVRYTAKGGGMKDDLLLALMICTRWMMEKRQDEDYINEANNNGIIDY